MKKWLMACILLVFTPSLLACEPTPSVIYVPYPVYCPSSEPCEDATTLVTSRYTLSVNQVENYVNYFSEEAVLVSCTFTNTGTRPIKPSAANLKVTQNGVTLYQSSECLCKDVNINTLVKPGETIQFKVVFDKLLTNAEPSSMFQVILRDDLDAIPCMSTYYLPRI